MNRLPRNQFAWAILSCLLFCGCGSSSPMTMDNFNKIQEGMTEEEVSKIMGFEKVDYEETGIVPGAGILDQRYGVDRETKTTMEGETYDHFHSHELGNTNKKDINITYLNGKVQTKTQVGLDTP